MNSKAVAQSWLYGSTPIRVLIADPDESVLAEYREILSRSGFEVVTATSALDCVRRLRERVPHVLVLEPQISWGRADGILAIMREVPALATVPVMLLTSCRDPIVLDVVAPYPISDYHVKPLAAGRLARRIYTCLDTPRPRLRGNLAERNVRLERWIRWRTDGHVHHLRIESVEPGRVIVHGCCVSLAARQLARATVAAAVEASEYRGPTVELNIDVCTIC